MANAVYPKFKEAILQAGVNLSSGTVKAVLVDLADYTYSASHQYLSDIPVAGRVATSGALTNKTFTNGVFDADNTVFSTAAGDQAEAVVLFVDSGSPATSPLIGFFDTGITNIPITPNGGNIDVSFNGAGIFGI